MAEPLNMPGLAKRTIIITGASSGIGLGAAESALASGAHVLGVDISPKPELSSANFQFLQCDLTKPDAADLVVSTCQEAFGEQIHALINVAGVMDLSCSVDTLDVETWERNIAINLKAPVMLMRAVMPVMKKFDKGSIVNVASKAGTCGSCAGVAYTASKHGIVGATKNVAFRFRHTGIRCNAITPGGVATNIVKSVDTSKMDQEAWKGMMPVLQAHQPDMRFEAARPVSQQVAALMFLASDVSDGISGAILPVDSAWSTL